MKSINIFYCQNKFKRIEVFNYQDDYHLLIAFLCLRKSKEFSLDILVSYGTELYNTNEFSILLETILRS